MYPRGCYRNVDHGPVEDRTGDAHVTEKADDRFDQILRAVVRQIAIDLVARQRRHNAHEDLVRPPCELCGAVHDDDVGGSAVRRCARRQGDFTAVEIGVIEGDATATPTGRRWSRSRGDAVQAKLLEVVR